MKSLARLFLLLIAASVLAHGQDLKHHYLTSKTKAYSLGGLKFEVDLPGAILHQDRYLEPADNKELNYFLHSGLWVGAKQGDRIAVVSGDGNPIVSEFTEWRYTESIDTAVNDLGLASLATITRSVYRDDFILPGHDPVGLTVTQRTIKIERLPILIFEYSVEPDSAVDSMIVGVYFDFDLPDDGNISTPGNDHVKVFPKRKFIAMSNAGQWDRGYIPGVALLLEDELNYRVLGALAAPLADSAKWELLTNPGQGVDFSEPDDYRFVVYGDSRSVAPGDRYEFTVALIHAKGEKDFAKLHDSVKLWPFIDGGLAKAIAQDLEEAEALPTRISLFPNYPNPFNPATTIRIGLPEEANVQLVVYDINGRQVNSLHEGLLNAGYHTFIWDGTDERGVPVSSGVYLLAMRSTGFHQTQKMIYLR